MCDEQNFVRSAALGCIKVAPGAGKTEIPVKSVLDGSYQDVRRINRMLDVGDGQETDVYVVRKTRSSDTKQAEERLREIEGVVNIAIYESDQHAPF